MSKSTRIGSSVCRNRTFLFACALFLGALSAHSQEGFPLDGTWRGEWGPAGGAGNRVVIVMKWNGETVTGQINPGPNSIAIANARLEASDWGVHIEAESADGESIRIDGVLEDVGSYNRRVVGSWRQGDLVFEFQITRE
jgi:hypothetical protein